VAGARDLDVARSRDAAGQVATDGNIHDPVSAAVQHKRGYTYLCRVQAAVVALAAFAHPGRGRAGQGH
jgi:hypothetical protein